MLSSQLMRIGLALAVSVTLLACGNHGPEQSEQLESSNGDSETAEDERMTEGEMERLNLEEAVDAARQDLAERSGVTPEAISVVEARKVTWRNGALGCPEEGMMYTQALVKGLYILLHDGDTEHAYHAGSDGKPFFCPAKRSKAPPNETGRNDIMS